jgi:hypothetical protein
VKQILALVAPVLEKYTVFLQRRSYGPPVQVLDQRQQLGLGDRFLVLSIHTIVPVSGSCPQHANGHVDGVSEVSFAIAASGLKSISVAFANGRHETSSGGVRSERERRFCPCVRWQRDNLAFILHALDR